MIRLTSSSANPMGLLTIFLPAMVKTSTFLLSIEEPKVLGEPHNLEMFLDEI